MLHEVSSHVKRQNNKKKPEERANLLPHKALHCTFSCRQVSGLLPATMTSWNRIPLLCQLSLAENVSLCLCVQNATACIIVMIQSLSQITPFRNQDSTPAHSFCLFSSLIVLSLLLPPTSSHAEEQPEEGKLLLVHTVKTKETGLRVVTQSTQSELY